MGLYFPSSASGGATAVNLTQVGGVNTSLGQKLSAASIPVVLASDQSLNVTTGPSIQALSGTVAATGSANGYIWGTSAFTTATLKITAPAGGATVNFASSVLGTGGVTDALPVTKQGGTGAQITSDALGANAVGIYNFNLLGQLQANVFTTAQSGGSVVIVGNQTTDSVTINPFVQIGNTANVQGAKTNNGAAPGTNLLGAVTGLANAAQPSWTEGNNVMLSMLLNGNIRTDATSLGGTAVVTGGVAGSQGIGGTTATNVAITDNPLNTGGQAVSSENAVVTTGRKVQAVYDLVGKQIILPYANPENFVSGAITSAMTGTTSTSLIVAPAAGLRNYITNIVVDNSHATVGTDIIIQDGSGGATLYTIPAAAAFGGASITLPTPLRQPTTATAIFCANVTTGSNTKVSATGYKGA